MNEFSIPYLAATKYFNDVERKKIFQTPPMESLISYMHLMDMNMDLASRSLMSSYKSIATYGNKELKDSLSAWFNTFFLQNKEEGIEAFLKRKARMIHLVTHIYPNAIKEAESDFGFHFETNINPLIKETDRFYLYQIAPTDPNIKTDDSKKPVIIIPPYVLGANILSFLPKERRSYSHAFANQGIPTYIRIQKDISQFEAVQIMKPEDDVIDTRLFCEIVSNKHGKPVTLNGYCQGGFYAACDVLSGELDDFVDALITCVSPMDGSKSAGLSGFLENLPARFKDLAYGTKTLQNGNKVADGDIMAWIYKLKSIENEFPIVSMLRDMAMFNYQGNEKAVISKTAAALNFWLNNERTDIPMEITKFSFDSYTTPVESDGTLPVKLFNKKLNFNRIKDKKIKWQICYGEKDDLVEKECALAPAQFADVEISPFPKGHVAIATSWSNPESECALHTKFGKDNVRGPVLFHLELDKELEKKKKKKDK
jgi:hypothetical protein